MKEARKLTGVTCMREDCQEDAVTRIRRQGADLELCKEHEEEFKEELRERIKDKYEGMDKDKIADKIINQGEGLL